MERIHLHMLGPVRVERGGALVHGFESRKSVALLCYLALQGQPRTRSHLAELFWGERPEGRGRGNLNRVLHNLTQIIPGCLDVTRQTIGIAQGDAVWLDVAAFESLAARDDPASLAAAAAMYRGDLLADFMLDDCPEFEQWLEGMRERWRQREIQVLQALVEYHLACGAASEGIAWAARLLQLDPWQEEAHRAMMRLLALSGQRSAALAQYELCRRALDEELGVEPEPATLALYQQLRDGVEQPERAQRALDLRLVHPAAPRSLPTPATSFVGREQELAEVLDRLRDPSCRLLTLIGPGGIGKSRLALEAAHRLAAERAPEALFAHGVAFVPLAAIDGADGLVAAIADGMQFAFSGPEMLPTQLLNYLRQKNLLLVLDNFEHLLAAAEFVAELLQHAPELKIMVTSRGRLNVHGEQIVELESLGFPSSGTAAEQLDWEQYSALQLFQQRAQAMNPRVVMTAADRAAAVRICQLVDGLPLGIELAASWVRLLPCHEIAREIEVTLNFLQSSRRDVPERHQSLQAVFIRSWNLLTATEQRVLRCLSVFRGGFERDAAAQVAGATLPLLAALLDNSLLRRAVVSAEGPVRYELLEVIRQYAAEQLDAAGRSGAADPSEVRDHHSLYYLAFLQQRTADLQGDRQQAALDEIHREIENIRSAWRWAVERGHVAAIGQAAESLFHFYNMRSWFHEGAAVFAQAAARLDALHMADDRAETGIVWGKLLARQGWFVFHSGRQVEAKALLERSLGALRLLDVPAELMFPLHHLAVVQSQLGAYAEARRLCCEGLAISEARADRYNQAIAKTILAQIAYPQGNYYEARRFCQESLATDREIGNRWGMAFSLINLGTVAYALGEYQESQRHFRESQAIRESLGDARGIALCLNHLGDTATALADHREARRLYQTSLAMFKEIGNQWGVAASLTRLGHSALALHELDASTYFYDALRVAQRHHLVPAMLDALAGIALALIDDDSDRARELAALVYAHPSATQESRDRAAAITARFARSAALGSAAAPHADDHTLTAVVETILCNTTAQRLADAHAL